MAQQQPLIEVRNLTVAYGDRVIQRDLSFSVRRGDVFVIMGGSGCGKSSVLRCLIGLKEPAAGRVLYGDVDLWEASAAEREGLLRRHGVLYQSVALWSSMTIGENLALPMQMFTALEPSQVRDVTALKLAMVGLAGCENLYPHELSGGMRKRAGLARAAALDPEVLFIDEPTAGLDPVSAKRLDDLILTVRDTIGVTAVVVTHELASIFAIGDDAVFLDAESKTIIARGSPKGLLAECTDPRVRDFLTRGGGAAEVAL
jgi:phospholipid/cholesterol/gamma-HCH transport system ATP-binding protein